MGAKEPDHQSYKINMTGKLRTTTYDVELQENEQIKYFMPLADDSIIVVPEMGKSDNEVSEELSTSIAS